MNEEEAPGISTRNMRVIGFPDIEVSEAAIESSR